ncbi:MAG: DUF4279 domain-containing protein [Methylobacterium sp.]|jgi:hypothetical protein|uniref:DUF4279 domain-containing protein n=1 Tax=unclassified Methylobacterium TaxID=2615210 RepID=UPI0011C76D99|nr:MULTISPECIES: DUF4279 domain-containing protein [unclassified Methylobacterium]MDO9427396.1 DUF4279 domain-containing protein [Methylobacterium sp.]TXM69692.1 DUF4279 domain-containing protein [Methylobacterium sp. WL69]
MMKTESSSALRAFATIRFEGDALDPSSLSDLLRVRPTLSYAKGETYGVGRRGIEKTGPTGYWFLNTKAYLETSDLDVHIGFLTKMLTDSTAHPHRDHKFNRIKAVVDGASLEVLVTLFWMGGNGAEMPTVGPRFKSLIDTLRGGIETDFTLIEGDPSSLAGRAA